MSIDRPGYRGLDAETGLSQNFHREYDSTTGRYVESDPIGLRGGSFSTYAYVSGNPVGFSDFSGLAPGGSWLCILPIFGCTYRLPPPNINNVGPDFIPPPSNVQPFPWENPPANDPNFCPDDTACKSSQSILNAERNHLIDFSFETNPTDFIQLIAINNDIIAFNRKVDAHNRTCPKYPVLPLSTNPTNPTTTAL